MIDFDALIEEYISNNRTERDNRKFRVSDSGYCYRMRFWKRQGKFADLNNDFNIKSQKIFAIGHLVHDWLQKILLEKGIAKYVEKNVENEHFIGHLDLFTTDGFLYDIKTAGVRKFQHIRKRQAPDRHHALQALTYAIMLEQQELVNIKDVRILYVSKDTMEFIDVSAYKSASEKLAEREMNDLINYWVNNELPPPEPKESWQCNYCPYKEVCKDV